MPYLTKIFYPKLVILPSLLLFIIFISGCSTYKLIEPSAIVESSFKKHSQTKQEDKLTVSTSILTANESKDVFGLPLKLIGIQAIWLSVENKDNYPYWVLYPALDTNYFSPDEVAYAFKNVMTEKSNQALMQRLRKLAFKNPIHSGESKSGYIFVNLDEDFKEVTIELVGHKKPKTFVFLHSIPGLNYQTLSYIETIHTKDEIIQVNDKTLKKALDSLPCCATGEDGKVSADPLNLVFIGNAEDLFPAFVHRGWHPAENNYYDSVKKTIFSFLFGMHYRYSPVSPLYAFSRKQDFALQKARGTIHQRNHLRLWLTPLKYNNKDVWVGQVSRDIGIHFTSKTPILVTHKIDPDIDEARNELIQEMLFSQGLIKIGFVDGIPVSTPEKPAYNLTGDPYFNDGLRTVLVMSKEPVAIEDVQFFDWQYLMPDARHFRRLNNSDSH